MNDNKDITSTLNTNDSSKSSGFILPQRLLRHIALFSDADLRIYLFLVGRFSPEHLGKVIITEVEKELSLSAIILRKSLFRLMAFGLIKMAESNQESDIIRVEVLSDSWRSFPENSNHLRSQNRYNDENLARSIAESLNDKERYSIYKLVCETIDKNIIRQALDESLRVPREKIKKSRAALFIHLIRKYAKP